MGSLSLIIVLIIVVWVIVLAPIVMGNNKPIRHSGDGYDATRVLHSGGSEPLVQRRRPKLSAADVHRYDDADSAEYEVVEAEQELIPSGSTAVSVLAEDAEDASLVDGEVVVEEAVQEAVQERSGSTALSVLREQAGEQDYYDVEESYASPADYGYAEPNLEIAAEEVAAADTITEAEDTEPAGELTEDEIAYARTRSGRGGWDPERERTARADRFQRRQRTLLGLIVADVVAFVLAFVAGGWAWVAPALTIALTVWFMVALRSVVRQERALHARRIRQLRRARMGVLPAGAHPVTSRQRRVPGAVIVDLDDESPDFSNLAFHHQEPSAPSAVRYEYDDYQSFTRAS